MKRQASFTTKELAEGGFPLLCGHLVPDLKEDVKQRLGRGRAERQSLHQHLIELGSTSGRIEIRLHPSLDQAASDVRSVHSEVLVTKQEVARASKALEELPKTIQAGTEKTLEQIAVLENRTSDIEAVARRNATMLRWIVGFVIVQIAFAIAIVVLL